MSRLSRNTKDEVRSTFMTTGSIRETSRATGLARNTIRRLLRVEGIAPTPKTVVPIQAAQTPQIEHPAGNKGQGLTALDFSLLEKLFESAKPSTENLDFSRHIKRMAEAIAEEIGLHNSPTDLIRLELAVGEFILYRRFFLKTLTASEQEYDGPWMKRHDKAARAVNSWMAASSRSLENFERILRDLEIKNGKRSHGFGRGNVFVGQVNAQVNQSR